jgi:penicillin amidase
MKINLKKLLIALSVIAVLALAAAGLYLNHFVRSGLPVISGELEISGLESAVRVTRDENGVAHIVAESEQDLFMAQGFVHAQDRLFQMDLGRRQASGRLAEVFGDIALEQDKYFRTLMLRPYAEKSLPKHSPETLAILQWYTDGVNAYIEQAIAQNNLPVEFQLVGYEPEPWSVYDSLTFVKYKAYDLGGHWQGQAFRAYLLQNFEAEKAYELFPSYPENAPFIISEEDLQMQGLFANVVLPFEHNGSNNWVVDGSRTASGKPMLADDPHLSLATPSIWYHNHLQVKGDAASANSLNVNGVSVAGAPGVILGHNEDIAWGVTNTGPDVQDLFIEKRNPDNPHQFLFQEEWQDASVRSERIYIDGSEPYDFELLVTRHGPIISELAGYEEADKALSLKWTALAPTVEMEAILGFNRARDWDSFNEAARHLSAPTQNFVFASTDGTIAFKVIGQIPVRGEERIPYTPAPGWTGEHDWLGFIPFDELPTVVNPQEGFVASANNKVVGDDYPYFISTQWAQPYRQMRIHDLLRENDKLSIEDMIAIQTDNKNLEAVEFLPRMLAVLENVELSSLGDEAVAQLNDWDYFDEVDAVASTIFNLWMREIQTYLFEGAISEDMMELFNRRAGFVNTFLSRSFDGEQVIWVEDRGGLEHLLAVTFETNLENIESRLGSDVSDWKWGNFHQVEFRHPLSSVSPLHFLFNPQGRVAAPGSDVSVNMANFNDDGLVTHGAGWRFVIDLDDIRTSHMIVAPGNSGHPRSPFYHNNIERWIEGDLYLTGLDVPEGSVLTLLPK